MEASSSDLTLLKLRNLELKLSHHATPSVVELLCDTIWGTPGGMRYQHLDTDDKIHQLHHPWFLYLEKDAEAIGVLCLDQRQVSGVDSFYIRYFSFSEGMRRKEVNAKREQEPASSAQGSRSQGAFKRFVSGFFDRPTPLFDAAQTSQALFYAFVELENVRSQEMVAQMGLSTCGTFHTHIFSRVFTRAQPQVRRARPEEHAQLRTHVRDAYADHAFYHDHALFLNDNFFVLEVDGRIVAGCQAHRVHWRIVEIPGLAGKAIMRVLPWIPLVSRLVNPNKFDFAAIEGLFCLPGFERHLEALFEGILHIHGLHSALLWLSKSGANYQRIVSPVRWGLLQRLKKDVAVTVVMRAYGLDEMKVAELQEKPVYVSAFDAT